MSLTDLVRGLFDYAGMSPPASLGLDEALARAAGWRKTLRRPSMVGADFVCGFEKLEALDPVHLARAGWDTGRAFKVCALGPALGGPGAPGGEDQRAAAARAVAYGGDGRPERATVAYEVRCPACHLSDRRTAEALEAVRLGLGGYIAGLFVEPDCASTEWPSELEGVFAFFDALPPERRPGLKVRCSGPAAIDPESLARLVAGAVDRGLKLKATAGLHHPIVEERYGNAAGFLGLALSVRLRRALGPGFSIPLIQGCLGASDPMQFSFKEGASWLRFGLSPESLAARPSFTIGCCDLREADDDLHRLFPGSFR